MIFKKIIGCIWCVIINVIYVILHLLVCLFTKMKMLPIATGFILSVYKLFFYGCTDVDSAIMYAKTNMAIYKAGNQLMLIIVGLMITGILMFFFLSALSVPADALNNFVQELTWRATDFVKNVHKEGRGPKESMNLIEDFKQSPNYYVNILIDKYGIKYVRDNISTYIHPATYEKKPIVITFSNSNNM